MSCITTVLQESRGKRRSVVLERTPSFENGGYHVLTSTRFYKEEDAVAFFEAESRRRIKKGGDANGSS